MTAYQGGKGRIGKRIACVLRVIENDILDSSETDYIEPFCGMCGVLFNMAMGSRRRIVANDTNGDVIEMWKCIQKGWDPPKTCSRSEFDDLKKNDRYIPSAKRGFVGSISSYGNIFMGYYRLHLQPPHRDYIGEGRKRVLSISKYTDKVEFTHGSYENVCVSNSIVYCDPPYIKNKFKTAHFQGFDHVRFWDVMREWSHVAIVVVSERTAPSDFKCIWNIDVNFSINKQTLTKSSECLFVHDSLFDRLSLEAIDTIKHI